MAYSGVTMVNGYTQPIYTQPIYTQPIYTQPIYTQPTYMPTTQSNIVNSCPQAIQNYGYYYSWPSKLTIHNLLDIDLTTGELTLKKMVGMDEIAEKFWEMVSIEYQEYLAWKKQKAIDNGKLPQRSEV